MESKLKNRINKTKSRFFVNKIDKSLARLTKKKKKTQITRIINERRDITTDLTKF